MYCIGVKLVEPIASIATVYVLERVKLYGRLFFIDIIVLCIFNMHTKFHIITRLFDREWGISLRKSGVDIF